MQQLSQINTVLNCYLDVSFEESAYELDVLYDMNYCFRLTSRALRVQSFVTSRFISTFIS